MTDHRHAHPTHDHPDGHSHDGNMAAMLDLDDAVTGTYVDEVAGWIHGALGHDPTVLVDAGAGTGAAVARFASHFPTTRFVAVDNDPALAARVETRAARDGFADRLRSVVTDLDGAWPTTVGGADVLWASSSLHHVADPERFLREAKSVVGHEGVLVLVEMTGPPRFDTRSPDEAVELRGLAERCAAAMSTQVPNPFPDWTPTLGHTGWSTARRAEIATVADPSPRVADYAHTWYARIRAGLSDELSPTDRATLDVLLSDHDPRSLRRRRDLAARLGRSVWIAHPETDGSTS